MIAYKYIYYFFERLTHRNQGNTLDYSGGLMMIFYMALHGLLLLVLLKQLDYFSFIDIMFFKIQLLEIQRNKPTYTLIMLPVVLLFAYFINKKYHKKWMERFDHINPFSASSIFLILCLFIIPIIIVATLSTK
jgi:hypothetical protein